MADVFILGAGFSKAIHPEMFLTKELTEKLLSTLDGKVRSEIEEYFSFLPRSDFESWLTYLSQPQPWLSESQNSRNHALFLDTSGKIGDVLHEPLLSFEAKWSKDSSRSSGQELSCLKTLVTRWKSNKDHIITLNYDTFVERASAEIFNEDCKNGFLYPAMLMPPYYRIPGYIGRSVTVSSDVQHALVFPLYKLHGSVNWFYSGSSSFEGETLYCSYVRREQSEQENKLLQDKVPLLIPPITEKIPHFQHETIRSLWFQAGQALRNASTVYSIGYSLPEADFTMRYFLSANAPRSKVKLYVVNRNTDGQAVQRYRKLLGEVYDIRDDFVGSSAIESFVNSLTNSKTKENHGQNSQNHN